MSKRASALTAEQLAEATRLRATPVPRTWGRGGFYKMCPRRIAKQMGVSERSVRRALGLEKENDRITGKVWTGVIVKTVVPPEVLAERNLAFSEDSLEILLMGSPRRGRSAYDRKRNEAR